MRDIGTPWGNYLYNLFITNYKKKGIKMEQFKAQELFTIDEVAKWCNMSRNAAYMHYRRGHITPVRMLCHRLYFTREEVDQFRANYCAFH